MLSGEKTSPSQEVSVPVSHRVTHRGRTTPRISRANSRTKIGNVSDTVEPAGSQITHGAYFTHNIFHEEKDKCRIMDLLINSIYD